VNASKGMYVKFQINTLR